VELDSHQKPVECGGVYVRPGDLVVADGDGVIVIPAERIGDALPIAKRIQEGDQKSRAQLYKRLDIPSDFTLGEAAQG
jgi:regulator of RNase E activity RraA